jgi:hypothetical protein
MIEITPTDNQKKEAIQQGNLLGSLQGSIHKGAGNAAGILGEIVVRDLLGYVHANTRHYDLYTSQGVRIDVKTKLCTSAPKDYYECSIISHGLKQECDEYIFARALKDLSKVWILGRIPKDEYFKKAVRHKKGERDESNGFTFKADCYNLPISELWKIKQDSSTLQSS